MLLKRLSDSKVVIPAKAGIQSLLFFLFLFAPDVVLAAPAKIPLPNPLGTTNILDLGARLIQAGLGIAGSLALLFFIYGGFLWLTSAGVPDKIKKGRDVFLWSTVGLVIIFSSYMMVDFVIKALTKSAQLEQEASIDQCHAIAESIADECLKDCKAKQPVDKQCELKCSEEFQTNTSDCKENTK